MHNFIQTFKQSTFSGYFVDLVPQQLQHSADVVRLRNQEHARYFMRQSYELTLVQQQEWYRHYERNADEAGFVVLHKKSCAVIGNVHFSQINEKSAVYGRAVFDLAHTGGTMHRVETNTLFLEAGFKLLGLQNIYTSVKEDNYRLQKFHAKMGFLFDGEELIRGCRYIKLRMPADNQQYLEYKPLIKRRARSLHLL